MDLAAALRAGPALLYRRPSGVLPYYLLAASAPAVARVPLLVAVAAAVAWLAASGRFEPVAAAVRELDPAVGPGGETPVGEANTGTGAGASGAPDLPAGLTDALGGLVTPTTLGLVAVGVVATLGCLVVARAVASAGTLAAVERALAGADPLPAGVRGIARHWRSFVGLAALRLGARVVAVGAVAVAVGLGAAGGGAGGVTGAIFVVAAAGAVLLALAALAAIELLLAFAEPAVVVDGVGARRAVGRAAGLATDRPWAVALYLVVAAAAVGGVVGVGVAFVAAGVPRLVGLLTALLVAPVLDGLRVALYAERGADAVRVPDAPARWRLWRVVRAGVARVGGFVRERPGENVASAALLLAGGAVGWLAVAPYRLGLSPPGDVRGVFGAVPVGPFVNIAANNWQVAVGAGYGGLALGVPSVAALAFNGALLGAVGAAFESTAFLALVAPHGVIELPAIAVSGAFGLYLGRVALDAARGRRDPSAVGAALEDGFRLLVGLGVVFVVAAAIEAFVTPQVAAAVLG
jgi:hypothetical protein